MFELIHRIPDPWRQLTDVLIAPLAWIPVMQHTLWDFFFAPGPWWLVTGKYIFLVFPALLAVAAVWCTQLSLYTLPFRSGRVQFIPTDRKSTRLNSSHGYISYAVFCLKKKKYNVACRLIRH